MNSLTKNELGIVILNILNQLKNGRYELEYDTKKGRYDVVIYNTANYGVYSAIFPPNHNNLEGILERMRNVVEFINKNG